MLDDDFHPLLDAERVEAHELGEGAYPPLLRQLGIVLDQDRNRKVKAEETVISAPNSRVKVLVIPTNEELVVAREVKRFLQKS